MIIETEFQSNLVTNSVTIYFTNSGKWVRLNKEQTSEFNKRWVEFLEVLERNKDKKVIGEKIMKEYKDLSKKEKEIYDITAVADDAATKAIFFADWAAARVAADAFYTIKKLLLEKEE